MCEFVVREDVKNFARLVYAVAERLRRRTQIQLQIARGLQIRGKRRKKRLRFHISVRTSIVVGALLRRFGLHSSWCFTPAMAAPVKELSATRQKEKGEIPRKTENQLQEGRRREERKKKEKLRYAGKKENLQRLHRLLESDA